MKYIRNQFKGKVIQIVYGPLHQLVEVELAGGDRLIADLTSENVRYLGIEQDSEVLALIKTPWVVVDKHSFSHSGRNQLEGIVFKISSGSDNTEVAVRLKGGNSVIAALSNDRAQTLALDVGTPVSVIIKAAHVILTIPEQHGLGFNEDNGENQD